MSLRTLMVHTVTIVHPGITTDRYGNETKNWATASRTDTSAWVSRATQLEDRSAGREAEVSTWLAYLPTGVDVAGGDRLEWTPTGTLITFEVDGPPLPAWAPRGPHHLEVYLRVVEG